MPEGRSATRSAGRPAPVLLLWGEHEFLLRLAAHEHLSAAGAKAVEVDASEWQGNEVSDLATPSLWGEGRALLVTRAQALSESALRQLAAYVREPAPGALCAVTVVTRGRNAPGLAKDVKGGGGEVRQVVLRRQDLPRWIVERGRARGVRLTGPGAAALVATLGEDAAILDQAVEQFAAAFAGRAIGPDEVRAQFEGLGEQRVWDLCDRAMTGRTGEALVVLRSLLQGRDDSLLILGGIASRLRDLVRVRALPGSGSEEEEAKRAGLRFDWQLRRYRDQAARYTSAELTELLGRVTDTDRAIKGGIAPEVALAALVVAMAEDRRAALDVPARVGR